jgi:hypothetical protein
MLFQTVNAKKVRPVSSIGRRGRLYFQHYCLQQRCVCVHGGFFNGAHHGLPGQVGVQALYFPPVFIEQKAKAAQVALAVQLE